MTLGETRNHLPPSGNATAETLKGKQEEQEAFSSDPDG